MTTYAHDRVHVRRLRVNYWSVAVIGLAAALVALGAWVLVDRYTGPTHDAATLIDDSSKAFSTGDAIAMDSIYAKDAVIRSIGTAETYTGLGQIRGLADGSFAVERVAPVAVEGDFATTYLKLTAAGRSVTSISVFQIRDGKIVRQWIFVPGQDEPFDNAVLP